MPSQTQFDDTSKWGLVYKSFFVDWKRETKTRKHDVGVNHVAGWRRGVKQYSRACSLFLIDLVKILNLA